MIGAELAASLNSRFIPGLRVYPTHFRPANSNFAGQDIPGIRLMITDREAYDSTRVGVEIGAALQRLYPGKIDFTKCRALIGDQRIVSGLLEGRDASVLWMSMQADAIIFIERRKPYLLY